MTFPDDHVQGSVLSAYAYHISVRIDRHWLTEIRMGRKTVEYRPDSEYWNSRCKKAQRMIKCSIPVILVLVCGKNVLKLDVEGIGLINVRKQFWADRGSIAVRIPKETISSGKVWAIHIGSIIEERGFSI